MGRVRAVGLSQDAGQGYYFGTIYLILSMKYFVVNYIIYIVFLFLLIVYRGCICRLANFVHCCRLDIQMILHLESLTFFIQYIFKQSFFMFISMWLYIVSSTVALYFITYLYIISINSCHC